MIKLKLTSAKLNKIKTEVSKIVSSIPSSYNRKIEKETYSNIYSKLKKCKNEEIIFEVGKTYTLLISKSYNAGSSKWTDTIYYFDTVRIIFQGETKCYINTDNGKVNKDRIIAIVK